MSDNILKNGNDKENLKGYCLRLSKKNNSILYLLEDYLGKKMLEDQKLSEIRDVILTVSAEILKIADHEVGDDDNEGL